VVDDEFFLSAEFIRQKFLEGASPDAPKIFGSAGALPSKAIRQSPVAIRCSLFATRHSLLAAVSARQEPRPPIYPPALMLRSPSGVAKFLSAAQTPKPIVEVKAMSLMGVDTGTTGVKAVIFNDDGEILGQSYREYPLIYPGPVWLG